MKSARAMVTVRYLRFLLFAVPFLIAVGAVGPRGCPIDVQCGDVLDLDYGQYRLSGDLVCPNNIRRAAVVITGEGVHFNLRGYTITREDGPTAGAFLQAGILVRGANAHIHNGSVVDINCAFFAAYDCAGIFLGEAPGVRINDMSLHNNTVGINTFSAGRFGGVVGNADGARIHGNDITGNLRGGIILSGFGGATAEGAVITDNDLSGNGGFPGEPAFGYLGTSDGVSLIGNVANDNEATGIVLFGSDVVGVPERNTIRDNTTLGNGVAGIGMAAFDEAFRPRDNLIQSNTAFDNGIQDLREANPEAGPFVDCLNTWVDNDFDVAAPDCIE